jgi:hypothetical protein
MILALFGLLSFASLARADQRGASRYLQEIRRNPALLHGGFSRSQISTPGAPA